MKKLLLVLFSILTITTMNAQEVVKLWPGNPPTDNEIMGDEVDVNNRISNVNTPELFIYKANPLNDRNIAVVICPGGGYTRLAMDHEGHDFAKWLQSIGITGVILKYRLPNKHKNVPLEDLQQAMRFAKNRLAKNASSPLKVGVAGFSAGGHLASTGSTHLDDKETRPDFSILFYPVITMGEYTHQGSKDNLLGENPSASDVMYYSNETMVTEFTPPTILLLSDDDGAVPSMNSIMYYSALKQNKVPATMYIFPTGGHGWGMRPDFKYHDEMLRLLKNWIEETKF